LLTVISSNQACASGDQCRNSPQNAGHAMARCHLCRLAPNQASYDQHFWSGIRGARHPALVLEKKAALINQRKKAELERRHRDWNKVRVMKKASRAEKTTERNIIKATKNSGRSHRDGDHVSVGSITLDTKLQSLKTNLTVRLEELDKVRQDALRAGNSIGGLVLRNRHGVGVVVFHEADYALLVTSLQRE
jgi:hypothetical protein